MIERAEQAMLAAIRERCVFPSEEPDDGYIKIAPGGLRLLARAAIEAMRDTWTDEMAEAAAPLYGAHYVVGDGDKVFRRIIDAALKTPTGEPG